MNLWADLQHKKWMAHVNIERRVRKIRRFFWNFQDDAQLVFWSLIVFVVAILSWVMVDNVFGYFR